MKRVQVGTSGWVYDDWVGPFYPRALAKERWIGHYAERFPTLEVNYTHYHLPKASEIARQAETLAATHLSSVVYKAPRTITHEAVPDGDAALARSEAARFHEALGPMADRGLLRGLLYQFAHDTGPTEITAALDAAEGADPPAPLYVEVRHAAFNEDRHYEVLRARLSEQGGALVATDDPAATVRVAPPGDQAYFRFHGRNLDTWFQADPGGPNGSARYDYRYSDEELAELAGRVREAEADDVLVFFNNHVDGQAPENAMRLMELMHLEAPAKRATLDDFV